MICQARLPLDNVGTSEQTPVTDTCVQAEADAHVSLTASKGFRQMPGPDACTLGATILKRT